MELLREAFSKKEFFTGKLMRKPLPINKENRLRQIYAELDVKLRTQKWFRILTEDKIESDIKDTGSDRFKLSIEDAEIIASDFGLI